MKILYRIKTSDIRHAENKGSEAVIRYLRRRCGILDKKTLSVAIADPDKERKQPSPSLKNPQVWQ